MCDDFCVIHGYQHMRKRSVFDPVAYCEACERYFDETPSEQQEEDELLESSARNRR